MNNINDLNCEMRNIYYGNFIDLSQDPNSAPIFQTKMAGEESRQITEQEINRVTSLYSNHCDKLIKQPLMSWNEGIKGVVIVAIAAGIIALAILFPHDALIGVATLACTYLAVSAYFAYGDLKQRKEDKQSEFIKFACKISNEDSFKKEIFEKQNKTQNRISFIYPYGNETQRDVFATISSYVQSEIEARYRAHIKEMQKIKENRTEVLGESKLKAC